MKFIFFTKTLWMEMPRLRHQLARLLIQNGHEVSFVEKPLFFWQRVDKQYAKKIDEEIEFFRFRQLIHHQMRVFKYLQAINAYFEKQQISNAFLGIDNDVVVVNFNYDYFFLKNIFPRNRIITILNDDFVAQCRLPFNGHMKDVLNKTCLNSDKVLTTSTLIQAKLKGVVNAEIFLPWAERNYKFHNKKSRDKILIWGYITKRYDFNLLAEIIGANMNYLFYFVGEVEGGAKKYLDNIISRFGNIVISPPKSLVDLPMDEFFSSLMLYKNNVEEITSITVTNKAFQLLAFGIPLIVSGMPNFMAHQAIFNCETSSDVNDAMQKCIVDIEGFQPEISKTIALNSPQKRLEQFIGISQ